MVAVVVLGLAGTGAIAQEEADAPAGVTFKGTGDLGVIYAGETKNPMGTITKHSSFTWVSNFDLAMSASGTTDGGLTFGAGATVKAGNASSVVGNSNAYIGGESWKISIGDLDPASIKGQSLGDVGFDGLGVDDVAEKGVGEFGADVELSFNLGAASLAITADQTNVQGHLDDKDGIVSTHASGNVFLGGTGYANDKVGTGGIKKQQNEWAAGASFDVGTTKLGIGMNSQKLMQASISADLGAFGGSLFFAQRKMPSLTETGSPRALGETADVANRTITPKVTGIGAEITITAGANTKINAVYAQSKKSDTRTLQCATTLTAASNNSGINTCGTSDSPGATNLSSGVATTTSGAERTANAMSKTDKGFGVGVSHNLGGGATLAAGFAKVKKQTKASVGISMSF